ncbi:MAG TPA: 4-phosphoerythronate dehydrogenase [Bacteroidota bacterium]|nr:4-phosphoerythronate dehydrogenase [Bacteroidota bacterium]
MRVVVDKKNPLVAEAFEQFGEVRALATREITKETVRDADIIVIRSETKVTKDLLEGSCVKFVATATIGTDHVDLEYLRTRGIGFANAPGSNANSVAEYFVAALLSLAQTKGFSLSGKTLGVVGVGNVGSKIVRNGKALGMRVLLNDPPLARATHDPSYLPLDDLMDADFISLHVPFTKTGPDRTHHLFDKLRLEKMKKGAVLINTARGPVVDGAALKDAIVRGRLGAVVLDVWEGEPVIDVDLLDKIDIGTPHIAGYSFDGKLSAVKMTYTAACNFFGQPVSWTPGQNLPKPAVERIVVDPDNGSPEAILKKIVSQCYDIECDSRTLRGIGAVPAEERGWFFKNLRSQYRVRREFFNTTVELPRTRIDLEKALSALGFRIYLS